MAIESTSPPKFSATGAHDSPSSGDSVNGEADSFLVGKPPRMASSSLFSPKDPGRAFQVQKVRQESPKVGR